KLRQAVRSRYRAACRNRFRRASQVRPVEMRLVKRGPHMKRCMFVDASSVIRKVAKRILGGPDLIVVEAESGASALDMCAAEMPDVIVVDGTLPDMQTAAFIRSVRSIETPVVPQILISL